MRNLIKTNARITTDKDTENLVLYLLQQIPSFTKILVCRSDVHNGRCMI